MLDLRIIIGRLTKDPEVKEIAADLKVARFTLACDGDFKDKEGNKKTEFVDVEAWRANADFAGKYLSKGRLVAVVGRMKTDEWEDGKFVNDQGQASLKRKGVLTIDKVYPLDKPAGSDDASYETPEAAPATRTPAARQTRTPATRAPRTQTQAATPAQPSDGAMPTW